jgi:predicted amidohydrolase
MNRKATISLVSYSPVPRDDPDRLAETHEKMGRHIREAAALKADLVAFPEICAYLYAPNSWVFEELDGPTISAMSKVARSNSVYVVLPQTTMEGDKRRNSSILFDRSGEIVGIYHKNFPIHKELDMGIIPGTETPVFETDFGRVGLTICFDINYWEVGHAMCENAPELVIWSSMWTGVRMMSRWAIEFGFYMAGVFSGGGSFIDPAGRPICSQMRGTSDATGMTPLLTESLDLGMRVVHHDGNVVRLRELFKKYGPSAATANHIGDECLLMLSSQLPDKSTDDLITEFGIEPTRDYVARARRDRQRALDGTYPITL